MSDLFPVRVRYSGLALGHEVGSIFSGGLGPMLAVALLIEFDAALPVSILLVVYALLAWVALRSLRRLNTRKTMIDKRMSDIDSAVAEMFDGAVVMVGGFGSGGATVGAAGRADPRTPGADAHQ